MEKTVPLFRLMKATAGLVSKPVQEQGSGVINDPVFV